MKVKSPAFENVSLRVVQDTVNLLFNMSSVPLSHDIYQSLEVMMEKMVIKVSDLENIWYLYTGAKIYPLSDITINTRHKVSSTVK